MALVTATSQGGSAPLQVCPGHGLFPLSCKNNPSHGGEQRKHVVYGFWEYHKGQLCVRLENVPRVAASKAVRLEHTSGTHKRKPSGSTLLT